MSAEKTAVFGVFPDRFGVEEALESWKAEGFRNTDVSVLFPENAGTKNFAYGSNSRVPEGSLAITSVGFVIRSAQSWLTGICELAIPGLGAFIAAGPIRAALAGAGGSDGGVAGSLIGMGVPEYEAKRYEGRIRKGGVLLSVRCDDSSWKKKAKQILEDTGAEDVASTG